jgi:26 proteasome complex subunit DSS1
MRTDGLIVDWSQEDTEVPGGTTHLWEESWDDDDENEDFSKQLR